jgi:hypothetical protein
MTGSSRRDPRWEPRAAQSWAWAQPSWAQDPRQQHLRIGDAERDRAAAELAEHYAAGRITTAEHSERLDQIWAAKTPADLAPVFADLPRPGQRPPTAPLAPTTASSRRRRRLPTPLVVLLAVLVVVTVLTHLPLILIGVAVWFLLTRTGACRSSHRQPHWRR